MKKDGRQYYDVALFSRNFSAEAVVRVLAYNEDSAVNLAKECMTKDFAPELHQFGVTISEVQ